MTYTTLLPARMGRLELRNRIVFPAMVTNYCSTRGEVTDRLVAYHQERAKGGAGLLITEATYISPDGKSFPHQLGIDDDGLLPGLRRLVESVHAAGARIAVQLCHAGRQTSRAVTGLPLLSPSVTRFGNDETCAMRQEDIDRVLRDYAGAALRAQKAGFDAVELHAGNGYLPQQFLSPFTNARQDGYGGSLENRVRFTVEAIRAVRAAVGPDFPIILRLGVAEPVSGGLTLEDGVAAARILAREDIDAFDVTAGMREGGMWVTPPLALPRGTHIEKAAAVRQAIQASRPVIGIGRITSASLADSFIAAGKVDFVVMGRALLADPELPLKTLQGREEGCNEGCIGRLSRGLDICCAVTVWAMNTAPCRAGSPARGMSSSSVPVRPGSWLPVRHSGGATGSRSWKKRPPAAARSLLRPGLRSRKSWQATPSGWNGRPGIWAPTSAAPPRPRPHWCPNWHRTSCCWLSAPSPSSRPSPGLHRNVSFLRNRSCSSRGPPPDRTPSSSAADWSAARRRSSLPETAAILWWQRCARIFAWTSSPVPGPSCSCI